MHSVRGNVRLLAPFACAALVAVGGCPVAYHDGLPAWTPPPGRPEASIGCHRTNLPGSGASEDGGGFWYLTPGARIGFLPPPLVGDIGLTSVVRVRDGDWTARIAPFIGIGLRNEKKNAIVMVRTSAYLLRVDSGRVSPDEEEFWQASVLAGNIAGAGRTHVSGGTRISPYGFGPVLLVDHSLGPANLRLEGSYMIPFLLMVPDGHLLGQLTLGLSVAGPAPPSGDRPGTGLPTGKTD